MDIISDNEKTVINMRNPKKMLDIELIIKITEIMSEFVQIFFLPVYVDNYLNQLESTLKR